MGNGSFLYRPMALGPFFTGGSDPAAANLKVHELWQLSFHLVEVLSSPSVVQADFVSGPIINDAKRCIAMINPSNTLRCRPQNKMMQDCTVI